MKKAEAKIIFDEMVVNFLSKESDLSVEQKLKLLELHSAKNEMAKLKIAAFSPCKF